MIRRTTAAAVVSATFLAGAASGAEFHMIHATSGNTAIGVFTPEGPQLETMQKGASRVDFIAYDPGAGTYFGQQVSTLGVIADGKLTPVEKPDTIRLSHPGGLAFDAERGSVLLASKSGAGTVLFEYVSATNAWSEIGNLGRDDFHGLACDGGQGIIYVLEKPHQEPFCTNLRVFNRTGAQIATVDLATPILFLNNLRPKLQLAFADGALYAMVTHATKHPRVGDAIFAIDPTSGEVSRTSFNAEQDLTAETWPGWKGGPAPSSPMSADTQGRGFYSNYETPASLVKRQKGELHVISIQAGETNYVEWLKKVKKVRAGSNAGGGVKIELELDPNADVQHPVVEVFVEKTRKPVTLALAAGQTVIWSIEAAPGAKIAKVVTFNEHHFSSSKVVGVDKGIVVEGGGLSAVSAWELEQSATRFDEMIETIREQTGMRENTFRGLVRATSFRVP